MSCPSATSRDGRSFVRVGAYVRSRESVIRYLRCSFVPIYRRYYINVPARYGQVSRLSFFYFATRGEYGVDSCACRTCGGVWRLRTLATIISPPPSSLCPERFTINDRETRAVSLVAAAAAGKRTDGRAMGVVRTQNWFYLAKSHSRSCR